MHARNPCNYSKPKPKATTLRRFQRIRPLERRKNPAALFKRNTWSIIINANHGLTRSPGNTA